MRDGISIRAENVSKKFCKSFRRGMLHGIADISRNAVGLGSHSYRLRKDEFWAVDDVSFEVKGGETLGIIGFNGSGKSTLLKMINGIFWPDKGKITITGKVGALIEVGAGFHPLLTGMENIYLNAAILGMTRGEVEERFDSIVEFADIGDFIGTPVKNYSSGMFVRLGFSVAVHCNPDILLVDEVLSVGDYAFQRRCLEKIDEIRKRGVAIVLVSHNMQTINKLSDRCLWIHQGKLEGVGDAESLTNRYHVGLFSGRSLAGVGETAGNMKLVNKYFGYGMESIVVESVHLEGNEIGERTVFQAGEDVNLVIRYRLGNSIDKAYLRVAMINENNINCLGDEIRIDCDSGYRFSERGTITVKIPSVRLNSGKYVLSVTMQDDTYNNPFYSGQFGYLTVVNNRSSVNSGFSTPVLWDRFDWKMERD